MGLPDYMSPNLKILFVGYNPGERSAALQHHFAGLNNSFWRLLFESELTTRLYTYEEDRLLLDEGYGLTNLVERPSPSSSDLSPFEMRMGARDLREKVQKFQPGIVCFLGKDIYRYYAGVKSGNPISYGPVPREKVLFQSSEFVAPNPSGRSTVPYSQKLMILRQLKAMLSDTEEPSAL
jgi:mismatch-specific thymine-DNA glycosylase